MMYTVRIDASKESGFVDVLVTEDRIKAWEEFINQVDMAEGERILLVTDDNEFAPKGMTEPILFECEDGKVYRHTYMNWREHIEEIEPVDSNNDCESWTDENGHWFADMAMKTKTTEELELHHLYYSGEDGYIYKGTPLENYEA